MLTSKKILMVVAHADDEIIIGWPIFQDKTIEKHILLLSTDENNKDRTWCNKRGLILKDICQYYNIGFTSFPLPSGFYKTPTRNAPFILNDIYNMTIDKINEIKKTFDFDYIFTHNPHGEYGQIGLHMLIYQKELKRNIIQIKLKIAKLIWKHIKFAKIIIKKISIIKIVGHTT